MATPVYLRADQYGYSRPWGGGGDRYLSLSRTTSTFTSSSDSLATAAGPISAPGLGPFQILSSEFACVSDRLTTDVTISGTMTFNIWAYENNMGANAAVRCVLELWNEDGTEKLADIISSLCPTEMSNTSGGGLSNWTGTPTTTYAKKGDRLKLKFYMDDNTGNDMAAAYTGRIYFNQDTAGDTGDSWVQFTETLAFTTARPSKQTTFYLKDTAGDDITAGTDKLLSKTAGASVIEKVAGIVAQTYPNVIVTKDGSTSGPDLLWFTEPLYACTIPAGSYISLNFYAKVDSTSNPPIAKIKLERTSSDGTVLSTICTGKVLGDTSQVYATWGTSYALRAGYFRVPSDVALSNGDRVKLSWQNGSGQYGTSGNSNAMTLTVRYATNSSDSYIGFDVATMDDTYPWSPPQTITLGLIESTPAIYDLTVSQTGIQAQTIEPTLVDASSAIYAPTVEGIGVIQPIYPELIESALAIYAPTVVRMLQIVDVGLIQSVAASYSPIVKNTVAFKEAAAGSNGSGSTALNLYNPGATPMSVRAAAGSNNGAGGSSITVTLPTGHTTGDVLLMAVHAVGGTGTTITDPSGWTRIGNQTDYTTYIASKVYWRVDDGSVSAPVVSLSPNRAASAECIAIIGASKTAPTYYVGRGLGLSSTLFFNLLESMRDAGSGYVIAFAGCNASTSITPDTVPAFTEPSGGEASSNSTTSEVAYCWWDNAVDVNGHSGDNIISFTAGTAVYSANWLIFVSKDTASSVTVDDVLIAAVTADGGSAVSIAWDPKWVPTQVISGYDYINGAGRLAYGNGIWVITGSYTSGVSVRASTDRETWTTSDLDLGNAGAYDVAYGNGYFVAVSAGGKLSTSQDGIDWTLNTSVGIGANDIYSVAYDSLNDLWMILAGTDTSVVARTATDPTGAWSGVTAPWASDARFGALTCDSHGRWGASGLGLGNGNIRTSDNGGSSWSSRSTTVSDMGRVVVAGDLWYYLGSGAAGDVGYSANGASWEVLTNFPHLRPTNPGPFVDDLIGGDGLWIASGRLDYLGELGKVAISSDGYNWVTVNALPDVSGVSTDGAGKWVCCTSHQLYKADTWRPLGAQANSGTALGQSLWWKVAGESEPGGCTLVVSDRTTPGTAHKVSGVISAFVGGSERFPYVTQYASQVNASGTTVTAPAVGSWATRNGVDIGAFGVAGETTFTPPTSYTEPTGGEAKSTSGTTTEMAYRVLAGSTSVGSIAATAGAAGVSVGHHVFIKEFSTLSENVDIILELLDGGSALYDPTVDLALKIISLSLLDGEQAVYAPTILRMLDILDLDLVESVAAIFAPNVLPIGALQDLILELMESTPEAYAPTVTPTWLFELSLLDGGAEIYEVTIPLSAVVLTLISSWGLSAIYAPSLELTPYDILEDRMPAPGDGRYVGMAKFIHVLDASFSIEDPTPPEDSEAGKYKGSELLKIATNEGSPPQWDNDEITGPSSESTDAYYRGVSEAIHVFGPPIPWPPIPPIPACECEGGAYSCELLDNMARSVPMPIEVRVATTGSITISTDLNAGDLIDGVTLANGNLVLVKDQLGVEQAQNGVWVVGASPSRADTMNESSEIVGRSAYVLSGDQNEGTTWRVLSPISSPTSPPVVIGATAIVWGEATLGWGDSSYMWTISGQHAYWYNSAPERAWMTGGVGYLRAGAGWTTAALWGPGIYEIMLIPPEGTPHWYSFSFIVPEDSTQTTFLFDDAIGAVQIDYPNYITVTRYGGSNGVTERELVEANGDFVFEKGVLYELRLDLEDTYARATVQPADHGASAIVVTSSGGQNYDTQESPVPVFWIAPGASTAVIGFKQLRGGPCDRPLSHAYTVKERSGRESWTHILNYGEWAHDIYYGDENWDPYVNYSWSAGWTTNAQPPMPYGYSGPPAHRSDVEDRGRDIVAIQSPLETSYVRAIGRIWTITMWWDGDEDYPQAQATLFFGTSADASGAPSATYVHNAVTDGGLFDGRVTNIAMQGEHYDGGWGFDVGIQTLETDIGASKGAGYREYGTGMDTIVEYGLFPKWPDNGLHLGQAEGPWDYTEVGNHIGLFGEDTYKIEGSPFIWGDDPIKLYAMNIWGNRGSPNECPECEDPETGLQIPPFAPGYMPIFRPQIGDPTTNLDSYICTLESGAMVLDWHTRGAVQVWGGELIPWCGRSESEIYGHGNTLGNVRQAWQHWGQTLSNRSGQTWDDLVQCLNEGRAIIIQGDYGVLSNAEKCQDNFDGGHAIALFPYISGGRILVGDPLCHDYHGLAAQSVRNYVEAMGEQVYGSHSPQPILFAVSRPWTP